MKVRKCDLRNIKEYGIWKHGNEDVWEQQCKEYGIGDWLCLCDTKRVIEFDYQGRHVMLDAIKLANKGTTTKREPYPTANDEMQHVCYLEWSEDDELHLGKIIPNSSCIIN